VLEHSKCQEEVYREKQLEQLVNREKEEEIGLRHMVTKYQSAIPNDLVEAKFVCGEARPFKKVGGDSRGKKGLHKKKGTRIENRRQGYIYK